MEDLTEERKEDSVDNDASASASQADASNASASQAASQDVEEEEDDEEDEEREEDNSCVQVYFQVKDQSAQNAFHQRCYLMVLEAVLEEKLFDQLRTKEQLGYYVSAYRTDTRGV